MAPTTSTRTKHERRTGPLLAILGALLIFGISIGYGFVESFAAMLSHVAEDLTTGLWIHAYIAGWVLVVVGMLYAARCRAETKR